MDDPDTLNHRAFGALLGITTDWRGDLVRLLRSDAPISATVRDELANAIESETTFGTRLDLVGHDVLSKFFGRFAANRESMVVGRYVAELVAGKVPVLEASLDAAEKFSKSDSECKRDYYYSKRCLKWTEEARKSGKRYSAMNQAQLESMYHMALAQRKEPLPGVEWDIQRTALVSAVREEIVPRFGLPMGEVILLLSMLPLKD